VQCPLREVPLGRLLGARVSMARSAADRATRLHRAPTGLRAGRHQFVAGELLARTRAAPVCMGAAAALAGVQRWPAQHEVVGDLARLRAVQQRADQHRSGVCAPVSTQCWTVGGRVPGFRRTGWCSRHLGLEVRDGRLLLLLRWAQAAAYERPNRREDEEDDER